MLDHALLRERFEALLDRERHVEGMYASMASESADPSRRELAEMLHREAWRGKGVGGGMDRVTSQRVNELTNQP